MGRTWLFAAAALIPVAVNAGGASAQSFGKPTPGVCFLSKQKVLDQSAAGAALQADKPIISQTAFQQRAGALALREQSFETLQNTRNSQITRTRARVTALLIRQMAPLLAQILSQRGCSAVFESSDAYAFTPAMDLTDDVIRAMNARLGQIAFDLEPPEAQ